MKTLDNKILAICMHIITPPILMFAFYLQFHGEVSPGGGFQSGIIFTIPIIVYIMLYGSTTRQGYILTQTPLLKNIGLTGVVMYILIGLIGNLLGGEFLDYSTFSKSAQIAQQIGIFAIEAAVCMAVFGSMSTIFLSFYKYIMHKNFS
ncbi:MnhB domain-containing protein [Candidatus Deianiraea vastatrix]|uniref:Monovalent cation/H+ antiporter n=1 Tax=Candidatus Deianiraea vastatrix TaxID=2163644 RepID=A0A5B8XDZ6_9RICK|nr:MnhB domain-containing protein [Candidatus Deianiraea vastatrix]QED23483.1 Putative monovalent cation/H+ antiporter [Candidatus Deianiraea vastatrix]